MAQLSVKEGLPMGHKFKSKCPDCGAPFPMKGLNAPSTSLGAAGRRLEVSNGCQKVVRTRTVPMGEGEMHQLREDLELERALRRNAEARVLKLLAKDGPRLTRIPVFEQDSLETADGLAQSLYARFGGDTLTMEPDGTDVVKQVIQVDDEGVTATIVWICMKSRTWNLDWTVEAKLLKIELGANEVVIVNSSLPDSVQDIGQQEGVWLVRPSHTLQLALVLRHTLSEIAKVRRDTELRLKTSRLMLPW